MTSPSQDSIVEFLGSPASHAAAKRVEQIDTHGAHVFLAGQIAYKMKRAVRYPFLDYSTLEKRHAACLAEIEANRPFSPELYLGVVPVVETGDGTLAIDAPGTPVEWLVMMRRFDANATLDILADAGGINAEMIDTLARRIARSHAQAPKVEAGPWLQSLARTLADNIAMFRERPDLFAPGETSLLEHACLDQLTRLRALIESRAALGRIVRGHGDLHLGNIALIDGQPVPFDALEFDPWIAAGDVLYDFAFLLMDLIERDLGALANVALNRWRLEVGLPEDDEALAALPFYLSLRAAIRAKVMLMQSELAEAGPRRQHLREESQTYFRLALDMLEPVDPILIAIGGLSGTGKSTLAYALAPLALPAPGAIVLRSDVIRKRLFGVAETDRLPPEGYTPEVTQQVYDAMNRQARRLLAAGHSVIADAVFGRWEERSAIARVARGCESGFRGLYLIADLGTRVERVETRRNDASDATAEVARAQEAYDLTMIGWPCIDAARSPEDTLADARACLRVRPH